MGMFDYVRFRCPECGEAVEEQSKAGPCELKDYTLQTAPPEVISDLASEGLWCGSCETRLRLTTQPVIRHDTVVIKDET